MTRQPRRQAKPATGKTMYMGEWIDAAGVTNYQWKPSPRLRKMGFKGFDLGTDEDEAIKLARAENRRVKAFEQGRTEQAVVASTPQPTTPKRRTFGDLVHEFRQDMAAREILPKGHDDHLSAKTTRQYRTMIKWLLTWAENGETRLDDIDSDVCADLRKTLVAGETDWTAAARLRMLRQVMGFAVKPLKWRPDNPMDGVTIPTPRPRTKRGSIDTVEWLAEYARTWTGYDGTSVERFGGINLKLAVLLGFYTTQREDDLLSCTRMNWRPVEDIDAYDRATLSLGGDGAPKALRVCQSKTGAWVTCFLPPEVAAMVDALIESRGAGWDGPLLQNDGQEGPERHWPDWEFRRIYAAMRNDAIAVARELGDKWLVDELTGLKYADMRRSGMCWMRDMNVQVMHIANISGHKIAYTMKILDTYMPGDARGAAAGIAHAIRTRAKRTEKAKQG